MQEAIGERPLSRTHSLKASLRPRWKLTLFGRSLALFVGEVLVNVLIWAVALALFAPHQRTRGILSLCLIAWTLGLRHGLDVDHIVAIDNVTRNLVSIGRLPVTVGLWFSLGHSSIVVGATIAIVVAISAIDKIPDVSAIGGVIGVSVSASFLFLLAVINSFILWQTIRQQRRRRREASRAIRVVSQEIDGKNLDEECPEKADLEASPATGTQAASSGLAPTTCLSRIGRPFFKLIDAPWKMYPVGVLFGFGFDTASEISLLGVSALAGGDDFGIPHSQILVLPLLFTAGMTFVDSCDSIFMLQAYAVPGRHASEAEADKDTRPWYRKIHVFERRLKAEETGTGEDNERRADLLPTPDQDRLLRVSVVLTVLSIIIALLISITQFMGLALEKCSSCAEAAESDPGLSGRWWRFWQNVNDESYFIGAGVVGLFIVVFGSWGLGQWWQRRKAQKLEAIEKQPVTAMVQLQEESKVHEI